MAVLGTADVMTHAHMPHDHLLVTLILASSTFTPCYASDQVAARYSRHSNFRPLGGNR